MRTLAIRLEDELHAQLTVIAQLEELTITDAIRQAIGQFIATKRAQPDLTARAEEVLADIDRDAAQRREAIAVLFGSEPEPTAPLLPTSEPPASEPPASEPAAPAGERPQRGRKQPMGFAGGSSKERSTTR